MICARHDGPLFGESRAQAELHLTATLSVPRGATGLILVIQAVGGREPSAFQQGAVDALRSAGFATCLVDLLDPEEADEDDCRTDIDLLTERLERVIEFLAVSPQTWHLPVGVLAADIAAAAAVPLAAERPDLIRTVASCCGRPDLSLAHAADVDVPVLLIVPARDANLLDANEQFFLKLRCTSQLALVAPPARPLSATDALLASEKVLRQWYRRHMRAGDAARQGETSGRGARADD